MIVLPVTGVVYKDVRVRGGWDTAVLVDDDDTVVFRIQKTPASRTGSSAGATVQEDNRDACGITAFLPVDRVELRYRQHAAAEWFLNRIHKLLLNSEFGQITVLPNAHRYSVCHLYVLKRNDTTLARIMVT